MWFAGLWHLQCFFSAADATKPCKAFERIGLRYSRALSSRLINILYYYDICSKNLQQLWQRCRAEVKQPLRAPGHTDKDSKNVRQPL